MTKGQKKGESKTYNAIHLWLKRNFGNSSNCERCGLKGYQMGRRWGIEWALKSGLSYQKKKENFEGLCKSCHRKQDMTSQMKANILNGRLNALKLNAII